MARRLIVILCIAAILYVALTDVNYMKPDRQYNSEEGRIELLAALPLMMLQREDMGTAFLPG